MATVRVLVTMPSSMKAYLDSRDSSNSELIREAVRCHFKLTDGVKSDAKPEPLKAVALPAKPGPKPKAVAREEAHYEWPAYVDADLGKWEPEHIARIQALYAEPPYEVWQTGMYKVRAYLTSELELYGDESLQNDMIRAAGLDPSESNEVDPDPDDIAEFGDIV